MVVLVCVVGSAARGCSVPQATVLPVVGGFLPASVWGRPVVLFEALVPDRATHFQTNKTT